MLASLLVAGPAAHAASPIEVPHNWRLKHADLGEGDEFRLVIITSTTTTAVSSDINTYNQFIEETVADGHRAIRPYASHFKAVVSTEFVSARGNADMYSRNSDEPIYWLDWDIAATGYDDFYDGLTLNQPQTENAEGIILRQGEFLFTGSKNNGLQKPGKTIGSPRVNTGRGLFTVTGSGTPQFLDRNQSKAKTEEGHIMAVSGIFVVGRDPEKLESPGSMNLYWTDGYRSDSHHEDDWGGFMEGDCGSSSNPKTHYFHGIWDSKTYQGEYPDSWEIRVSYNIDYSPEFPRAYGLVSNMRGITDMTVQVRAVYGSGSNAVNSPWSNKSHLTCFPD